LKLTAITDRLFHVEDVFPYEIVSQLQALDWTAIAWKKNQHQQHWPRRQLEFDNTSEIKVANQYLIDNIAQIGEQISVELSWPDTNWWVDEPGFDVAIHTDGHLAAAMQLYWHGVGPEHGTVFYNSKNSHDVLYPFKFVPNSGYLMLNQLNLDGSQPLQWHGMQNPVPPGHYRVSSYTHFANYKTK